jgi:chromosome partitioning protein
VTAPIGWPQCTPPALADQRSSASPLGWPDVSRETSTTEQPQPAVTPESERETEPVTPASVPESAAPPSPRHDRPLPFPKPVESRIIVVANQKGGVGKTTTTVNLAAALAQGGLRILVIDLDPQGNASTALSVDHSRNAVGSYDAVIDGKAVSDLVVSAPDLEGVDVLAASIDLAGAEIELVSLVARESRLDRALQISMTTARSENRAWYDIVLIDCPPSLGLLTLNAMVAATELLVPIQAEYYALEGLGQLTETVELVTAHLNPRLQLSTILLTMYDARTRLAAQVADEVRTHFGERVLKTTIPRSVRVSEAPSYGQTVVAYDPASAGALAYVEAARELASTSSERQAS